MDPMVSLDRSYPNVHRLVSIHRPFPSFSWISMIVYDFVFEFLLFSLSMVDLPINRRKRKRNKFSKKITFRVEFKNKSFFIKNFMGKVKNHIILLFLGTIEVVYNLTKYFAFHRIAALFLRCHQFKVCFFFEYLQYRLLFFIIFYFGCSVGLFDFSFQITQLNDNTSPTKIMAVAAAIATMMTAKYKKSAYCNLIFITLQRTFMTPHSFVT